MRMYVKFKTHVEMSASRRSRLLLEGLSSSVSKAEIQERFKRFGKIVRVRRVVEPASDGEQERMSASVDLETSDAALRKCVLVYSKTRWKGSQFTVRVADEHSTRKLQPGRSEKSSKAESEKRLTLANQCDVGDNQSSVKTKKRVVSVHGHTHQLSNSKDSTDKRSNGKPKKLDRSPEGNEEHDGMKCDLASASHDGRTPEQVLHSKDKESKDDTDNIGNYPEKTEQNRERKRELSNQKRLAALQQHQDLASRTKLSIDPQGKTSSAQHIVFNSSDESVSGSGGEDTPPSDEAVEDTTIRRTLFASDTEESDSEHFAVRRQFEGRTGEKLFQLQQRIGMDKRFRLDERFIESEEESECSGSEEETSKDESGVSLSLDQEKSKTLSIIDSLLGSSVGKHATSTPTDAKWSVSSVFPSRYDPTSATCGELEQPIVQKVPDLPDLTHKAKVTETAPEVSSERFYHVSSDLTNLFSGSNEGQQFSFLDKEDSVMSPVCDEEEEEEESTVKEVARLKPKWMQHVNKTAESDGGGPQMLTRSDNESLVNKRPRLLFFFHSGDAELANRLEENCFHRQGSLEELEGEWEETRAALREDYKNKHREAIKLARKKRRGRRI